LLLFSSEKYLSLKISVCNPLFLGFVGGLGVHHQKLVLPPFMEMPNLKDRTYSFKEKEGA